MTDSIKAKILKLLAKADNTACTVEEAAAFNAKAHELMQRHNLDRAMLEPEKRETIRTHKTLQVVIRPWSSSILHGLAALYYCKWYYSRLGRMDTVTLVGEESNVAVCHALAVMTLRAVQSEARVTGGGRSFMTGAAGVIYQRCMEMSAHASLPAQSAVPSLTAGQGQALMVLKTDEESGNREYINKLTGGALKPAKKSKARINDSSSYSAGRSFGATVPLRQNLLGGR